VVKKFTLDGVIIFIKRKDNGLINVDIFTV